MSHITGNHDDICLVDIATTHTILNKRYISQLVSGGIKFQINDALFSRKSKETHQNLYPAPKFNLRREKKRNSRK